MKLLSSNILIFLLIFAGCSDDSERSRKEAVEAARSKTSTAVTEPTATEDSTIDQTNNVPDKTPASNQPQNSDSQAQQPEPASTGDSCTDYFAANVANSLTSCMACHGAGLGGFKLEANNTQANSAAFQERGITKVADRLENSADATHFAFKSLAPTFRSWAAECP